MSKQNDLAQFCLNENEIIAFGDKIKSKLSLKIKKFNNKKIS